MKVRIAAGAAIAAVGVWVRALASGHVRKNEELTTTGPYAYTRNPLYLGSIIIAIGFAVAARNVWIGIVLIVMFLAIYMPVIRGEEAFLRSKFPNYDDYAAQVPRLVPTFRSPLNPGGGFSRALYLQHREYNAILGALVILAALACKLVWYPH